MTTAVRKKVVDDGCIHHSHSYHLPPNYTGKGDNVYYQLLILYHLVECDR